MRAMPAAGYLRCVNGKAELVRQPLVAIKINSTARVKLDALIFKQTALQIRTMLAAISADAAAGIDNPMPGDIQIHRRAVQRPTDRPRRARIAEVGCDLAVGGNFALRNSGDKRPDVLKKTCRCHNRFHWFKKFTNFCAQKQCELEEEHE